MTPTRLLLLRRIPEDSSADYEDDMLDQVKDEARAAEIFFEFAAPELGVRIMGDITRAPYDPSDEWNKEIFKAHTGTGVFFPTHFMMIDGYNPDRCGETEQFWNGGRYAKVFTNNPASVCGVRTICHELGHMLNLRHVGTVDRQTGAERNYNSNDDIMGVSGTWRNFSAASVFRLGLYTAREIMKVTSSWTGLLAPLELRERDLFPDEYRFIYLPNDGTLISIRKALVEYPLAQPVRPEQVYVHRLGAYYTDKKNNEIWDSRLVRLYRPELLPGQAMSLPSRTIIEHLWYENEQAKVRVKAA